MLMIGKQLTPQQRVMKAASAILSREELASINGVLLCLDIKTLPPATAGTPSAMTNGLRITFNEAFVDALNDAELRFVYLHEVYHCLFKHLFTWEHLYKKHPQLANAACDYVINLMLYDLGQRMGGFIQMPASGGLLDERFRDMDAAQVFRILWDEHMGPDQESGDGDEGDGDEGDEGDGTEGTEGTEGTGGDGIPRGFDDHDWEGAQGMSDEQRKEVQRTLDEALRQGAVLAGKLGSGGIRELDELLEAKVRWQDALREWTQAQCAGNDYSTWRRPNRRYISMGAYLPSAISERIGQVVIAPDMSGSIGQREVSQFLGEMRSICEAVRPEGVRLLYWDTAVCRDEYYPQEQLDTMVSSTKPAGGGGTAPSCITAYMAEHNIKPQVVIVLTDGYVGSDWGESGGQTWPCPVLWCIVGNKSAEPTIGKPLHIEWNE